MTPTFLELSFFFFKVYDSFTHQVNLDQQRVNLLPLFLRDLWKTKTNTHHSTNLARLKVRSPFNANPLCLKLTMNCLKDFLANQEGIDYFLEVFQLKCSKYPNLKQSRNMPLAGSYQTFVLNYWPGAVECCDRTYTTCKSFQLHLTSHHIPPKKLPRLSTVPTNSTVTAGPSSSSSVIDRRNG